MGRKKGSKNQKHKKIYIDSVVFSLSIKIYDEQLTDSWESTIDSIKNYDSEVKKIVAIKHYLDLQGDSFFAPSVEKVHYHIYVESEKQFTVSACLKSLGIAFRPDLDESLIENKGLEIIKTDFASCLVYATHETKQAILDMKYIYPHSDIVSNLSDIELDAIRENYNITRKYDKIDINELDLMARKLAHDLKDFDDWWFTLPPQIRFNNSYAHLKESYYYVLDSLVKDNFPVNRLCVFIKGSPNVGKTYCSRIALNGYNLLTVGAGGSGRFDKLKNSTDAIIVDDSFVPDLLNISDNYACYVYRRKNNNPIWFGKFLIITSNYDFEDYCKSLHFDMASIDALRTRFYITHVANKNNVPYLFVDSVSKRGSYRAQLERRNYFIMFRNSFNSAIKSYHSSLESCPDIYSCFNEFEDVSSTVDIPFV
ncbi:MAG: hypothetical protein MJ232_03065 [archaeon]|nr:hypothetical protein [archaeon]